MFILKYERMFQLCISEVECLTSMYEALGLTLSNAKNNVAHHFNTWKKNFFNVII